MEAEQENNGDQNLLRNDLGDNRGTKIKREIPQLLIFNELRDSTVPGTGTKPYLHRKLSEIKYSINQYITQIVFSLGYKNKPLFCCFWLPFGYPIQIFFVTL